MAGLAPPPPVRPSLSSVLANIDINDDEIMFNLISELEEDEQAAIGFRHAPASTQAEQDRHLKQYREFIRKISRLGDDVSDEDLDTVGYPADIMKHFRLLRMFLQYVFKTARPRSGRHGETIDYTTIMHYRQSMMFWSNRKYADAAGKLPYTRGQIYNQLTEGIRYAYSKFRGTKKDKTYKTTLLGLPELRQMLDYEMCACRYIEVSEQHQLIWCILRQTAVRPGSIARDAHRTDFLQLKHLEITTGIEPGTFKVIVDMPNIKARPEDAAIALGDHTQRRLPCHLKSPDPDNIIMSVPHRLLVMLLRRKVLVGIETLDQLLAWPNHLIEVKPHHLEDPLFYRSKPKGAGIDMPHPITVLAISHFIANRALALGYRYRVSAYSLRRKTATDLVARIGYEATREIMGHKADSRTLERYYVNLRAALALTETTLGQEYPRHGISIDNLDNFAPLALGKLGDDRLGKIRGSALNAVTKTLIANDENFPVNGTEAVIKAYKKRIRRYAVASLLHQQHTAQQSAMTRREMDTRQELLDASNFAEGVIAYATDLMSGRSAENERIESIAVTAEEDRALDAEELPDIEDEDEEPEADREDEGDTSYEEVVTREEANPSQDSQRADADEIPYLLLAQSFMEILLENKLSTHTQWKDNPDKTCPLCQEDETVSDERKKKEWKTRAHLDRHINTDFHSNFKKWIRMQQTFHDAQGPDSPWFCPYCEQIQGPGKSREFESLDYMLKHVRKSTASGHGDEHENLKIADGWFEDDFVGHSETQEYLMKDRANRTVALMREVGFEIKHKPGLLTPKPTPNFPGLDNGGPTQPVTIPAKWGNVLMLGNQPGASKLNDQPHHHLQSGGLLWHGSASDRAEEPHTIPHDFVEYLRRGNDVALWHEKD